MLEKVVAENKLSDTPGNSFNVDESRIQINKTWLCNDRKGSKNINVLTSGEKNENITVMAFCNAAGQFLLPVLISWTSIRNRISVLAYPSVGYIREPETVVNEDGLFHQVVHRSFAQTQGFRKGHSTFRWPQNLLQLPFTVTEC